MSVFMSHQRNASGVQQLITDEETGENLYADTIDPNTDRSMRYSALSECSSYYGVPGAQNENDSRFLCKNPMLRANMRVVIGSTLLTIVGAAIFCFGLFVMLVPNDMGMFCDPLLNTILDVHGWIFLVVGGLFFTPGIYHVIYILCFLCGRPGYDLENLSTFRRP